MKKLSELWPRSFEIDFEVDFEVNFEVDFKSIFINVL